MNWLSRNDARFGNKIFAYFFLAYLQRHSGIKCTASEWLGNSLFTLPFPIPSKSCEPYLRINLEGVTNRNSTPLDNVHLIESIYKQTNLPIDIAGSFQYNTDKYQADDKELFLATYRLNETSSNLLKNIIREQKITGHFIAIHYRAGDYLKFSRHPIFWTPPFSSVIEIAKSLISNFPTAKLFLASDSLSHKIQFRDTFPHHTIWNESVSKSFKNDLIFDFLMLTQANLVVASNSSFSIAACMMNTIAGNFVRPLNRDGNYVVFDPWKTQVLIPC